MIITEVKINQIERYNEQTLQSENHRTIVVFNPISGHGHLDSWNALFVKVFLKCGWKVFAITRDIDILLDRLSANNDLDLSKLVAFQYGTKIEVTPNLRSSDSLRRFLFANTFRGLTEKIVNLSSRLNSGISDWGTKLNILILCLLHFFRFFLYRKIKSLISGTRNASDSLWQLIEVENFLIHNHVNPDLIFHMYLDSINFDLNTKRLDLAKPEKKWAGIRFAPRESDLGFYSLHPELSGVCFLDPSLSEFFSSRNKQVHFTSIPDITDGILPSERSNLVNQILSRANGRKIIFLGGMIGGQKNVQRWYELIRVADSSKYFFLQAGNIHTQSMNLLDLFTFYSAMCSGFENLMVIPHYMEREVDFNEMLSISDVIFAVYRNFYDSSNMLAKASVFGKPILVSDRYLMGRLVTLYGIGAVCNEQDSALMLKAIEGMAAPSALKGNFLRFQNDFNADKLSIELQEFVEKIISGLPKNEC